MMNCLNTYRRYACDVNRINTLAKSPEILIKSAELSFAEEIGFIAEKIAENNGCIVLLSGPSGSGKTTTAQKLCEALERLGKITVAISLDNFYLGADYVPRDCNNNPDFESVYALDIHYIKKCLRAILEYRTCVLPKYNFAESRRSDKTAEVKFQPGMIAVVEGMHALNPLITAGLPMENVAKIYASVKQGIKNGEETILSNRDIRFIRRVVRDHEFRNVPPEHMLGMWESVCDGEQKYIRPYRYQSDFTVNTIHIYEPCVMSASAIPLLEQIPKNHEKYDFASNILKGLRRFEGLPSELIPKDSLIREFIGGGCYSY